MRVRNLRADPPARNVIIVVAFEVVVTILPTATVGGITVRYNGAESPACAPCGGCLGGIIVLIPVDHRQANRARRSFTVLVGLCYPWPVPVSLDRAADRHW